MSSIPSNEFPPLQNDRILKAAKGETPDKIPIWIMRQAGRYLPEFREFRERHSFFEICQTPELACEVTMMPIKRFRLDAAIIFSDILVVPQALGMTVEMKPKVGPVIEKPLTIEDIDMLQVKDAVSRLKYVGEAITLTRKKLNGIVPLIGFSGAPWTLMGYMVEGGGSKTMSLAKKWLYAHPEESTALLTLLTSVIIDYLVMQVEAGAQLLQVFESSAEFLNKRLFTNFCLPYLGRIRQEVRQKLLEKNLEQVPMILFAKGSHYCLAEQANLGYDVISVDWTIEPELARTVVQGKNITLQGNLDPCCLYAPKKKLQNTIKLMIERFGSRRYIANLGHGIYPDMDPEAVQTFINAVHNFDPNAKSISELD